MSSKKLFVFLISVLLAGFLCISCQGKKNHEAPPIKVNPDKDIHEVYEKVVKEREKNAINTSQGGKENLREKNK